LTKIKITPIKSNFAKHAKTREKHIKTRGKKMTPKNIDKNQNNKIKISQVQTKQYEKKKSKNAPTFGGRFLYCRKKTKTKKHNFTMFLGEQTQIFKITQKKKKNYIY
jgi:hypothetical protein